uniref:Response regulator receiver domain-containing protein n=1 Tax=Candidatus Kentrum sp. DK TaxID=2126562 RepID=A0A450SD24_9GAMM|nr:MAG: Response regulator receiver domain-containing protein [Candidatus Kentron sp. DK]
MNSNGKVLVVDDEKELAQQFGRALRREGYTVELAYSGEEAWEKYQQQYFDVVITDWRMGKMDGIELASRINAFPPSTHIIIITGFGTEFERRLSDDKNYHPFDYLGKGAVTNDVLLEKVRQAMARRDPVIEALEEWVEKHPEEADEKTHIDFSHPPRSWSAREMLMEIKGNTKRGREEYKDMIKLTFHLMTHGNIDTKVMECARESM